MFNRVTGMAEQSGNGSLVIGAYPVSIADCRLPIADFSAITRFPDLNIAD